MESNRPLAQRLARSPDGVLAGICEGIGQQVGIDPNWLRVAWVAAALFFGTGLLLYLVLWWVVPRSDTMPEELAGSFNPGGPPLRRTSVDRKIFGVCGGLARRWNLDPSAVRLAALALLTASVGLIVLLYLIATLFIPRAGTTAAGPAPHPVEF